MHDPMNLIWLCHTHSIDFDRHMFGLTLGGLDNSVRFISFDESYRELVDQANKRLSDTAEPYYDMSYVSRRAIGMRLFQAQKRGHFANHDDPHAWETVVRLSATASANADDSDDED